MDIESERKVIKSFVDKANFHAAMNISISALNECRHNEDKQGIDIFLTVIRGIAETMTVAYGSRV